MLFTSKGSVRMIKNCDLGLENAALSLRPRVVFLRPRSQFFTIWTSQPANNIYVASCHIYHNDGLLYIVASELRFQFFCYKSVGYQLGTNASIDLPPVSK